MDAYVIRIAHAGSTPQHLTACTGTPVRCRNRYPAVPRTLRPNAAARIITDTTTI